MGRREIAVLVMAYGTPHSLAEVEAYYTHIRRGRKPMVEEVADLVARYEAIGGVSPLFERTMQQVLALETTLNREDQSSRYKTYLGMKHVSPFIEETVAQIATDGFKDVVGLVLAPHYSRMSVGDYLTRATTACTERGLKFYPLTDWYRMEEYLQALAGRLKLTLPRLEPMSPEKITVLFSAHSLPKRIIHTGDPYVEQMEETCRLLAERVELPAWRFAWQSAGKNGMEWLEPDILTMLDQLAAEGMEGVVSCPIGFVSDHLEVLYDLDIEAKEHAEALGLKWVRTPSLNADALLIQGLAKQVVQLSK